MPQQPDSSNFPGADAAGASSHDALEQVVTFVDLVNELNCHLSQLQYALLDLKEVLVQCDDRQRGRLAREAAAHIERIRDSARDDPSGS